LDKVSSDTIGRRRMVEILKTATAPLSVHELARAALLTDQAARDFINCMGKAYLTPVSKRPKRYWWKTNPGRNAPAAPAQEATPSGTSKIVLSWIEADLSGKRRRVRVTLEGIPVNGHFSISGLPGEGEERIQK
jgi:hypothetical protein